LKATSNAIAYADDVVIIGESKGELKNYTYFAEGKKKNRYEYQREKKST